MGSHPHDDGFHEIQLSGKQLVFLFMAATVVSVVIFLFGVLVGRSVPASPGNVMTAGELSLPPAAEALPPPAAADADTSAPDDLSYFHRLDRRTPPVEELKPLSAAREVPAAERVAPPAPATDAVPPPAATTATSAPAAPPPPAAAPPPAPRSAAAPPAAAPPAGASSGYAVQLAALNSRTEADAMADRLVAKGYAAYVLAPASGAPAVYRVRVGAFPTRREAEAMAARLQKEERFEPWITR